MSPSLIRSKTSSILLNGSEMSFVGPFVRLIRGTHDGIGRNRHLIYIFIICFLSVGMPTVLETMFDYVDYRSLAIVQKVCTVWNETVNTGPYWRRKLKDQVGCITQTLNCRCAISSCFKQKFDKSTTIQLFFIAGVFQQQCVGRNLSSLARGHGLSIRCHLPGR